MTESARFVWELEYAVDQAASVYASREMIRRGHISVLNIFRPNYWRDRTIVKNEAYSDIKKKINAAVPMSGRLYSGKDMTEILIDLEVMVSCHKSSDARFPPAKSDLDLIKYGFGIVNFSYANTETSSGGFTVLANTAEKALQKGRWLKDVITAILREKYSEFHPYVHEIPSQDVKEISASTQLALEESRENWKSMDDAPI